MFRPTLAPITTLLPIPVPVVLRAPLAVAAATVAVAVAVAVGPDHVPTSPTNVELGLLLSLRPLPAQALVPAQLLAQALVPAQLPALVVMPVLATTRL